MSDFYGTLGVDRDASFDEIKKVYRKLAREYHPDINDDPSASDRFKEITKAYEVLSDPDKRQRYDMGGDPFSQFGGGANFGFGDIMDAFFGGGASNRGPRARMRNGQDALIRVEIDLQEACFGTDRELNIETAVPCDVCSGSGCADGSSPTTCGICKGRGETQQVTRSIIGQVMTSRPCAACQGYGSVISKPCNECAGDGRVRANKVIPIKIPAGVETGNRIQMSGAGEVGPGGGPAGDLYVEIIEVPHDFLIREGNDLHISISIPMTSAALGTKVNIETLDGLKEVTIKPGFISGQTVTLKDLGINKLRGHGRGDLIVHVEVQTPAKLSKEQEELLKTLANLRGESADSVATHKRSDGHNSAGFFGRFRDAFNR
ncbi:MAG: molecular chaperone DnaJ [Actinomycetes bacterium]